MKRDPVSPKKTFFAELKLCIKNPNRAPIDIGKKNIISFEFNITTPAIQRKKFIKINTAKPSSPSIRFSALTIIMKTNKVIILASQSEISYMPKIP